MQVCLCGAEPSYPHAPDCPHPLFRASEREENAWYLARLWKVGRGFICRDYSGNHYAASEQLAAGLERENQLHPVNVPLALSVEVGKANGLRWARHMGYKVVAYAAGGYSLHEQIAGPGWCLSDGFDPDVERALCFALGIRYEGD